MNNTLCLSEIIVLCFVHLKRNLSVLTEVHDGAKKQFTYWKKFSLAAPSL